MIFADKLIALRKKEGWSQEELAQQLNVSRQSVSKWEGAQSVPDLDKIVQLSRIFGVSTDYLLKDELEEQEPAPGLSVEPPRRRVSLEEASRYLELRRAAAPRLALATFLCVISPIALILLGGLSEYTARVTENAAAGVGLSVLIVLVAAAVGIFLTCGAKAKAFAFLETEPFETEYGVSGMVKQRRQDFEQTANRLNLIGTILCIVSVLPLFVSMCLTGSDGGRLPVHVRCLLDEFANIGQIPNFDKLIATIRSREISASIILQSQSQLKTIYKDAADTIVGNCDTTLFLGGKEKSTLKEISELLGKETIDSFNQSENRGSQVSHGLNYQKLGKDMPYLLMKSSAALNLT